MYPKDHQKLGCFPLDCIQHRIHKGITFVKHDH